MWKNPIPALLVAAAALTSAMGTAHAGNVTWSVGIQAGPPVVYGPPPVYMAPSPVYVAPPPPGYYAPPPRVVYGPPPVVMWGPAPPPPPPGWRHHHHRRHDRGDWDGDGRYRR